MGIAGSPGGVEAAAGTMEGAGRDLGVAADSIASHGRAVTAEWIGSAADAAAAAIAALADRTRSGAGVCAGVGPVLRVYAAELRAAQGQYDDGFAAADAGASALRSATAAAHRAGALAQDDPGRADAQAAAVRAGDRADAQVRAGQASMTAAVGRAERANAAAAAAIDALTDQLADMTPTGSAQSASGGWGGAAGGDWGEWSSPSGSGAEEHHHGWFFNAVGGLGNAAWSAGPGFVGDIAGWSPFAADKAVGRRIEGAHDWLASWYGADTDSGAYRGGDGAGQVATFLIPGEGWVKGGQALTRADDLLRLSDNLLRASDEVGGTTGAVTTLGRHTGGRTADDWDEILGRVQDPASVRAHTLRESYAEDIYAEVRASAAPSGAEAISMSSGLSPAEVEKVRSHLFLEEHPLDGGIKRFDVDPDIADAWRRLTAGRPIPADVDLLRHELAESTYMAEHPGVTYVQAHEAVKAEGFTWAPPEWQDVVQRSSGG